MHNTHNTPLRPYAIQWTQLLTEIVETPPLHAKWLNTLSYLENCGARKIATCEHPTKVKEEMLKHAAEEFRHAHYLKSQICRISEEKLENYSANMMLGSFETLHYLNALDIYTCQHLKKKAGLSKAAIKEAAYILVTYAIELRASELYPVYHEVLRLKKSPVAVKSILLEEEEHLAEMEKELANVRDGKKLLEYVCQAEGILCGQWIQALQKNMAALRPL